MHNNIDVETQQFDEIEDETLFWLLVKHNLCVPKVIEELGLSSNQINNYYKRAKNKCYGIGYAQKQLEILQKKLKQENKVMDVENINIHDFLFTLEDKMEQLFFFWLDGMLNGLKNKNVRIMELYAKVFNPQSSLKTQLELFNSDHNGKMMIVDNQIHLALFEEAIKKNICIGQIDG